MHAGFINAKKQMKRISFLVMVILVAASLNASNYRTTGSRAFGQWKHQPHWLNAQVDGETYHGVAPIKGTGNITITISGRDTILLGDTFGEFASRVTLNVLDSAYLKIFGNFRVRNHVVIDVSPLGTFIIDGDLIMHQHGNITVDGAMQVTNVIGHQNSNSIGGTGTLHLMGEISENISVGSTVNVVDYPLDDPMPVDMLSFTAGVEEKQVVLRWTTASEVNSMGFEIMRLDTATGHWQVIGWKDGQNNHNGFHQYRFTDPFPAEGANYYRLRQLDYDGTFSYYGPVSLVFQDVFNNPDFKVNKNPSSWVIALAGNDAWHVEIHDLTGRSIYSGSGVSNLEIPAPGVPVIIRVSNARGEVVSRVVM
jgi:hypothetical protein